MRESPKHNHIHRVLVCPVHRVPLQTAAVDDDGGVWIWGHGGNCQLGTGSRHHECEPLQVRDLFVCLFGLFLVCGAECKLMKSTLECCCTGQPCNIVQGCPNSSESPASCRQSTCPACKAVCLLLCACLVLFATRMCMGAAAQGPSQRQADVPRVQPLHVHWQARGRVHLGHG